jgi:hypothetical protein
MTFSDHDRHGSRFVTGESANNAFKNKIEKPFWHTRHSKLQGLAYIEGKKTAKWRFFSYLFGAA